MAMDKMLRFRISDGDRLLLQKAADRDRRSLSDWCRLRLLGCARSELSVEQTVDYSEVEATDGLGSVQKAARKASLEELLARKEKVQSSVHRQTIQKPGWKK